MIRKLGLGAEKAGNTKVKHASFLNPILWDTESDDVGFCFLFYDSAKFPFIFTLPVVILCL
jgi:hypothetical protein